MKLVPNTKVVYVMLSGWSVSLQKPGKPHLPPKSPSVAQISFVKEKFPTRAGWFMLSFPVLSHPQRHQNIQHLLLTLDVLMHPIKKGSINIVCLSASKGPS